MRHRIALTKITFATTQPFKIVFCLWFSDAFQVQPHNRTAQLEQPIVQSVTAAPATPTARAQPLGARRTANGSGGGVPPLPGTPLCAHPDHLPKQLLVQR